MKCKLVVKKLFAVLLSCSMLVSALTGCGSTESETESSSATEEVVKEETAQETKTEEVANEETKDFDPKSITEGVKLTIAVKDHVKVEDYNTNTTTLRMEEEFGVDLEFVTYPSADYQDKLNVMVMSGDKLPDIIFDPGSAVDQWAAEGALIPLNEYYEDENLTPYMHVACTCEDIDIPSRMMSADGNIWGMPKWARISANEVYKKVWMYEPWLEAVGMEVPTTTEEFYEVCKAVSEADLNGNGKKDEVAFTGTTDNAWFDALMSAFVYSFDGERRVVEDGQVSFAYMSDEWKEGLKYIKKYFDEGIIPQETLTQNSDQYRALEGEGLVFSFVNWWYMSTDPEMMKGYIYVPALTGPEGEQNAHYSPFKPSIGAVITVDCENPEAAVLVLDYMLRDDMSCSTRYGLEGKDWDYWDNAKDINKDEYKSSIPGKEITMIAYDDATFWAGTNVQNDSYIENGCYFTCDVCSARVNAVVAGGEQTPEQEATAIRSDRYYASADDAFNYVPDEVYGTAPLTQEETESIAEAKANLKDYVSQATSEFLLGTKDIEADWDAYLTELEKIGYEDILAVYQAAYDRVN